MIQESNENVSVSSEHSFEEPMSNNNKSIPASGGFLADVSNGFNTSDVPEALPTADFDLPDALPMIGKNYGKDHPRSKDKEYTWMR